MTDKVIRYTVRPKNTIRGWFVWAVVLTDAGDEKWAPKPYATVASKYEAQAMCDDLNHGVAAE